MSEYCERCVHTDAEIQRLTRERDEVRDEYEAYVAESRALTGEDSDTIASLRAQVAQMKKGLESAKEGFLDHLHARALGGHGLVSESARAYIADIDAALAAHKETNHA